MAKKEEFNGEILLCTNKKAYFNYFLSEFTECGIELKGSEIKALRLGHCSLDDSYVIFRGGEAFVLNMNIPLYQNNGIFSHEPTRTRKLLLHKQEIRKLIGYTTQKGLTLVPLQVYLNEKGLVKMEIAVARGKKLYDKREDIAKRDAGRRMERMMKDR